MLDNVVSDALGSRWMDAKEVKRLRNSMGLSVTEFANEVGVHWTTVYRWERGEAQVPVPTARMIRMLAREKGAA